MAGPRVVLDTDVLVSALCFGGKPARILRLAFAGKLELLASSFLVDEFERIMEEKFPHRKPELLATINELSLLWTLVPEAGRRISVIKDDPSDNRVLECAEAGKADFLVSGDKHLLTLTRYGRTAIVTPAVFLDRHSPRT